MKKNKLLLNTYIICLKYLIFVLPPFSIVHNTYFNVIFDIVNHEIFYNFYNFFKILQLIYYLDVIYLIRHLYYIFILNECFFCFIVYIFYLHLFLVAVLKNKLHTYFKISAKICKRTNIIVAMWLVRFCNFLRIIIQLPSVCSKSVRPQNVWRRTVELHPCYCGLV